MCQELRTKNGFCYQHFGGPQRDNASLSHGAGGNGYKYVARRLSLGAREVED